MNTKEKINFISNWIRSYVKNMPKSAKSLIIGVSGGIDSSVSSTLSAMTGLKTIVFNPVIALKVLETDESIPPETPITRDLALTGIFLTYSLIQLEINFIFSLVFI